MEQFLANVERRALRMAELAVGNRDDALDIVQDAMLALVKKYGSKPADDWPALFHRILQNRIRDWYRRQKSRNSLFGWLPQVFDHDSDPADAVQQAADKRNLDPAHLSGQDAAMETLQQALRSLPLRQQQAFLLRSWEGLDIRQTAYAMGCSEGSVKTHYSRALQKLRQELEDDWP